MAKTTILDVVKASRLATEPAAKARAAKLRVLSVKAAPIPSRAPTDDEVRKAGGSPILAAIRNAYNASNGQRR